MSQQNVYLEGVLSGETRRAINANFTELYGQIAPTSADALTAHAGGTQAAGLQLAKTVNRLTVVATAGDSVVLPASVAGNTVIVINSGANPAQVYGFGPDTINDVAAATGVTQMPNSIEFYVCPVVGKWYVDIGTGYAGSLTTDSYTDNITATPSGTQGTSVALTTQFSRITTVATIADGVTLPAAKAGLDLIVINHGANAMQVFGAGTDTVDDVAGATGVAQMAGSVVLYVCVNSGKWYTNGIGTGFSGAFPTVSYTNNITAFATGGQASATLFTTAINRVTTVGTAGDSVKLPAAAGGMQLYAANAHATNSMNVFPSTGDAINALAANAAFAVPAGKTATFISAGPGFWHAILSA